MARRCLYVAEARGTDGPFPDAVLREPWRKREQRISYWTPMSLMNRDRYRKKMRDLLSRSPDEDFFEMVWAIDALQSDRSDIAARYLQFPAEAATTDLDSKLAIRKWDLETLIGQLLVTPKRERRANGPNRITNCRLFHTGATAVSYLRELENAESGIFEAL